MNEFDELVALILEGLTYANVHTEKFPGGSCAARYVVPQQKSLSRSRRHEAAVYSTAPGQRFARR